MSDPGLGLPTGIPGLVPVEDDRDFVEYTLPRSAVGKKFAGQFQESDLTFRVYELDPESMAAAAKRAGGTDNRVKLTEEMTFMSVGQVGGWKTRGQYEALKKWWKAIGFKGRMMVQKAVDLIHNVEEEEIDMFLDSAKPSAG